VLTTRLQQPNKSVATAVVIILVVLMLQSVPGNVGKFRCQVCSVGLSSLEAFSVHMNSTEHRQVMNIVNTAYKDRTQQLSNSILSKTQPCMDTDKTPAIMDSGSVEQTSATDR